MLRRCRFAPFTFWIKEPTTITSQHNACVQDDDPADSQRSTDGHYRLSITHKLSTDGGPQFDIRKTGQSSPHHHVAGWRIVRSGEVAAKPRNLGEIGGEYLGARAGIFAFHQRVQQT